MTILLLALLGWVLVSFAIGGLWMWGHRPRPEQVLVAELPRRVHRHHARAS